MNKGDKRKANKNYQNCIYVFHYKQNMLGVTPQVFWGIQD